MCVSNDIQNIGLLPNISFCMFRCFSIIVVAKQSV